MLSPFNAAPIKDFNPFPRSPAVCLTESLPSNVAANCLLLSAGDPRHVFYTIHRERENGKLPCWAYADIERKQTRVGLHLL